MSLVALFLFLCIGGFFSATHVAYARVVGPGGSTPPVSTTKSQSATDPALTAAKGCTGNAIQCSGIIQNVVNPIVIFLSIGFGIVVTIMFILGGIQYTTAGGDAQAVAGAKKRIANALLALIAYAFMFAIFEWLIPGGFGG